MLDRLWVPLLCNIFNTAQLAPFPFRDIVPTSHSSSENITKHVGCQCLCCFVNVLPQVMKMRNLCSVHLCPRQRSLRCQVRGAWHPMFRCSSAYPCASKSVTEVVTYLKMMHLFLSLKCETLQTAVLGMSSWFLKQ
jgi:hypothetical protein